MCIRDRVYVAISRIRNGWIVNEQPIAANAEQDLVWRLVGRPGIVLFSEGPSSRVRPLLEQERKKAQRLMRNVAITTIQVEMCIRDSSESVQSEIASTRFSANCASPPLQRAAPAAGAQASPG